MNQGISMTDAVRELAKKIREVQKGFEPESK
jgi:uncharacterized protein YoaH (UPF0181 family)